MELIILSTALTEFCFWTMDPLKVHQSLNDGEKLSPLLSFTNGILNALPLILFYISGKKRSLNYLSHIAIPLIILFTVNQCTFWWWPYLLGDAAGVIEMVSEHKRQLAHLPRVLPEVADHLVPDIEHTLLFVMSVVCLVIVVVMVSRGRVVVDAKSSLYRGMSVVALGLPLLFVVGSSDPLKELGSILTSMIVGLLCYVVPRSYLRGDVKKA
eukprot:TRINITY_DN790_c0_g1_i1.p1 TRINITY_DN790_c0_g1~~TRINITY_DN790_c0_g1_i1.p1  ORF type:complete len:212 (+),score=20.86 TRINITY_DN790_c0_g1_i1:31-666(+)